MITLHSIVAGKAVESVSWLEVYSPYSNELVGKVSLCNPSHTEMAIEAALSSKATLTRYQRSEILDQTARKLESQREALARLITLESGLCIRETQYEVGRAIDVFRFASMEALKDDGQTFSCDVSAQGKQRKIFTLREPVSLVAAITPFNHPLNQVAHKVAPAIAAGAPIILKPSEKTPLTALRLAEILYESGLPPSMLSLLLGPTEAVARKLVTDPRVDVLTFTGSVKVGKMIAAEAGYKRIILELGGNDPLIVLEDADLELATHLAAEGSFRNSGQRCTAVKRILVDEKILEPFTALFLEKVKEYTVGDPLDPETRIGTVIDEQAAIGLVEVMEKAVAAGARKLYGGRRKGAQLEPTVIGDVPRDAEMVTTESFGPLAPILSFKGLDDAIQLANGTAYGLSSGVVTRNLEWALQAVRRLKVGTVNINEVPGYRIECSPFGGIKDSGLGVKEGVIEAIKCMTTVKTFSLPW